MGVDVFVFSSVWFRSRVSDIIKEPSELQVAVSFLHENGMYVNET